MRRQPSVEPLHSIGEISFAVSDLDSAVKRVHAAVEGRNGEVFAFCNMHTFNLAKRSSAFASVLKRCTVFNDGIGIDLASRLLCGVSFPANLNGTDMTPAILATVERPLALFLVGSEPGVAEQAARNLEARYEHVSISGVQHGYFDAEGGSRVINEIVSARPDLVLVGMGNPRQELWALQTAEATGVTMLCVGAFIDFAAGRFSRAPLWVRKLHCEWLYRLALEPRRLAKRYIVGGIAFACAVGAERLRQGFRKPQSARRNGTMAHPSSNGF